MVGRLQDTGADVTLTSWAPDKRYNSKTQDDALYISCGMNYWVAHEHKAMARLN